MRGRWGGRLAATVVAACGVLGTASCGADDPAAATAPSAGGSYLALGDSVPFGFHVGADYRDQAGLVGYPSLVGEKLNLRVIDATCPGETTASFVDAAAASNGCERSPSSVVGYRSAYPLHVHYASADQSQLDFAVRTLKGTRNVRLVTLQIGANDAFLCQQTTADHCAAPAEQLALVQQVQTNLTRILSALHDDGGYRGRVVVVTYYALDYSGAAATATQGLDTAITITARDRGAVVADGFAAFRSTAMAAGGSSVSAGLVYRGDVHPTAPGQALLAGAVEAAAS